MITSTWKRVMLPKMVTTKVKKTFLPPKKQTKLWETEESSSLKGDADYGAVAVDRSESRLGTEEGGEPHRDPAVDQDGADDSKDTSLGNMLCECWKYRVPGCQPL